MLLIDIRTNFLDVIIVIILTRNNCLIFIDSYIYRKYCNNNNENKNQKN